MHARISCIVAALLLLLSLMTWEATGAPQAETKASDPLALVPGDSIGFVHVEGKSLWNSSILDELQKNVPAAKWKKFEDDLFQEAEKISGIARKNLRSATLVIDSWEVPQIPAGALLFTSTTPLDPEKYIKGAKAYFAGRFRQFDEGHSESPGVQHEGIELSPIGALPGQKLYACLLQPSIAVIGELNTIKKLVNQQKQGANDGPLGTSVKAARGHDLALGIQLPEAMRNQLAALLQMAGGTRNVPEMQLGLKVFEALLEMDQMHLFLDIQKDLLLNISVKATNEKAAIRFQRFFDMWALMGDFGLQYLSSMTNSSAPIGLRDLKKFFGTMAEAAASSKTTIEGTKVNFTLNATDAGPQLMSAATSGLTRMIMLQDRQTRQMNLRQLAIAMHNYHNDYNRLPAPAVYKGARITPAPGSNEKPLLSWRVTLLPYIEYDQLYKQFHFDEPWDSEHNKKLIPLMPKIYACPGATDPGPGKTYLQVFVAPEKPARMDKQMFAPIFQLGKPSVTLGQLTVQDGASNTIMIAESSNPVIWTKPDDIVIEDDTMRLPKLGCVPDEDDFLVAFGDGTIRAIRRTLPNANEHEKLLRQLIGRRDGMNQDVGPIMK
ncbi:MAG: DUF1559 domain-containing protein [Gemmatales bacterium]